MENRDADMEELMLVDDPEFDEVMECVFGIQSHQSRTYFTLANAPGSTVSELAQDLNRDRSSVNRSLTALFEKNLVERERRLMEGGGYVYQYFATPLSTTKERMHAAVDEWSSNVHQQIENFGQ